MNSLIEGVLYVDDQDDMCELMVMVMESHGIKLDTARTFEEAAKVLHLYKILITDHDLSCCGKDGNLLAKKFKEICPAGYVIMVTGWSPNLRHIDGHVDECMIKPINGPEIAAIIAAKAA